MVVLESFCVNSVIISLEQSHICLIYLLYALSAKDSEQFIPLGNFCEKVNEHMRDTQLTNLTLHTIHRIILLIKCYLSCCSCLSLAKYTLTNTYKTIETRQVMPKNKNVRKSFAHNTKDSQKPLITILNKQLTIHWSRKCL